MSTSVRMHHNSTNSNQISKRSETNSFFKSKQKQAAVSSGAQKFRLTTQSGKKLSKIRWINITPPSQEQFLYYSSTEHFATGSWGEKMNEISFWRLSMLHSNEIDDLVPDIRLVQKLEVDATVTDIVDLRSGLFGSVSSNGTLNIFKTEENAEEPNSFELISSKNLHKLKNGSSCPATGIATDLYSSLYTVGEDGSIFQFSYENNKIINSFLHIDPLSITSVVSVGRSALATGNSGGQVKVYDIKSNTKKATQTLNKLDSLSSVLSISQHPTQGHVLLVGYASGATDLWDLRKGNSNEPIANLEGQEGGVSEINFHPLSPDNFFTASQGGELNHWYTAHDNNDLELIQNNDYETDLNLEFLKYGLACKSLYTSSFPLNSLSLSPNNRILCGGDNGVIFCSSLKGL